MPIPDYGQYRWIPSTHRILLVILGLGLAIGMAIAPFPGLAQPLDAAGNAVDGYPVQLDGQTLFYVRSGIPGVVSPKERAQIINQRLTQVANDPNLPLNEFRVESTNGESLVKAGETVLFTVREADAKALKESREVLSGKALQLMRTSVSEYRESRSWRNVVEGVIYAIVSTIAMLIFLKLVQKIAVNLLVRVRAARQANALSWRFRDYRLLGSDATSYLLGGIIRLSRLVVILGAFSLYLPFLLSQFPATKTFGKSLLGNIAQQFQGVIDAFVAYLPNLITLGIIAFITNYVIDFAKLVISELGRDDAYTWFYPEWVNPTSRLVSFAIVAIACVIGAPFLPGFGSPAFQGVSLFLGALFTLGSSSAVSNAVAGVILIYTRAFRIGDVIRIGDTTGKVIDKSLFVTRIVRFPQEVVVIPNTAVLSGNVINYSAVPRVINQPLIIHTSITLGYDLPWRKVEETLIKAALATPGILSEPSPFVLQTGLNDFHVGYQLNVFTDCPEVMPITFTKLHQNIQDYCNAVGIEIMSPNFFALRDGNHSTIPSDYLPTDYETPGFQVKPQNGDR
ncbi:MAG: mechanosensitive ion channel family protein [Leptolyngbyaceae cyanobacterium bins.349]|nr:mechanosensitive ion channel family protein [Leptolyngbyaceae cyanobacterium bins.349]